MIFQRVLLSVWYLTGSLFGQEPRVTIERPIDPVIPLVTQDGNPACTGFVIGKNLIATAAHCVDSPLYIEIAGAGVELEVLAAGEPGSATDVALLEGPTGSIKPLELGDLELPTACFFYGFAGGRQENLMPCFLYSQEVGGVIGGMGEVRPGDSGGPVLGRDGKVIAIIFAGSFMNSRQVYVAPVSALRELIKAALDASARTAPLKK